MDFKKQYNTINKYHLVKEPTDIKTIKINNANICIDYLREIWDNDFDIAESFFVLFLNNNNEIIGYKMLSKGGATSTIVDIKILVKYAINCLCNGVIVAHNHPSGNLNPSKADELITSKIRTALNYFDIMLLDSLILTNNNYKSI